MKVTQPAINDSRRPLLFLVPSSVATGDDDDDDSFASFKDGCWGDCNIVFVGMSCRVRPELSLLSENDVAPWSVQRTANAAKRMFDFIMMLLIEVIYSDYAGALRFESLRPITLLFLQLLRHK